MKTLQPQDHQVRKKASGILATNQVVSVWTRT